MGADLEGEILSSLVDEQTLSIGLSDGGGAFPDVVLSIPVRDATKFEPLFARATTGLCADLSERGDVRLSQRAKTRRGNRRWTREDLHQR